MFLIRYITIRATSIDHMWINFNDADTAGG